MSPMKALLSFLLLTAVAPAERVSLFDGKTLEGWEVRAGEEKWWSVKDGMITGGSLDEPVPHNTFLATRKRHANFDLRLKVRLVKGDGFMNSGIQVRSIRVPGDPEMCGYQIDAGAGWWGKLYDESRRNKVIAEPVDPAALKAHDWDWNDYRILCEGPRIRTWINGVASLDFTETDPAIPLEGLIGLQAHGGGRVLAQFKEITIEELPPTAGAPAWPVDDPRSPEREKASFQLADGFEAELVASEREGVGKPVTMAWDHAGRMWTMTALEYPVDANENEAHADALYARGGKDRVLVFDEPWKPGPQVPRVFADGLAIPLGLLPYKGGALVQHGREIRYYEDRNADGTADGHSVVLKGFGIQDSHLFPHQFERAPGGWFLLAQGLFNYSTVVRPDGSAFAGGATEVAFNQCKLARAKLDGKDFQLLTAGPNNIWGFASAKDGREYLQEANDLGHPVSEFIDGAHYPTGSSEKLRPYAPVMPPSTPGQPMGGTGLSGLALAEDEGSPFAAKWPGQRVFYLANPITNRIQIVTQAADGSYRKQDDFLIAGDEWFRPVSVQFGPDGCLYIADWYNKIISHNEVPRSHPERDKTRGRIWRIKPEGVAPTRPPDLTRLGVKELADELGNTNARVARMAWAEFGDRGERPVSDDLALQAAERWMPKPKRLGALWAMHDLGVSDMPVLRHLARDPDPDVRREAIEWAGEQALAEKEFLEVIPANEPDFRVRCACANALFYQAKATPAMVARIARLVGAADPEDHETDFVRYLVRRALERHPVATAEALEGGGLMTVEARVLASLALPPERAAPALLALLPELDRPLGGEELSLLGSQLKQPAVAAAFAGMLEESTRREGMLQALLQLDPAAASDPALRAAVGQATRAMAAADEASLPLASDLARRFRLKELAPVFSGQAADPRDAQELALMLRTLNEIGAEDAGLAKSHLDHPDEAVVREALAGFAAAGGDEAVAELARRWPRLGGATRQFAVNGMLSNKGSAEAFARAVASGGFAGFDPSAVEKLAAVLGKGHPAFRELLSKVEGLLLPVVRLSGKPEAVVATDLSLQGPFTVETWIKLDDGIDNRDGLLGTRGGGPDINFYDGRLRLWSGSHDVVIADRPMAAGVWTHCAVTRDAAGRVALFLDGEPAGISQGTFSDPMSRLDVGRANRSGGTGAQLLEFRVWDRALSVEEIRAGHRVRHSAPMAGVTRLFEEDAARIRLQGGASIEWTTDFPELVTPAQAKAGEEKFERFRIMASRSGDAAAGKLLFRASCLICHQARGEGVAIGPDLSGAGAMGEESLLRNILTPNAQLESGYYRHDITLADGSLTSGFLVSETATHFVIRQIGGEERAIPKDQVKDHAISKRSLMPEGLIDGWSEKQVADLFAHLMTLK